MNKILIALIVIGISGRFAAAQSTAAIDRLLSLMPAQDQQSLEQAMQDVGALGENGLVTMAAMLSPGGQGKDTALQYAINGFSYYVAKAGRDTWRSMAVKAYCEALGKVADRENKAFLIRQLQITGKDDAVPCLQQYLQDEQLGGPATRALEQINTAAANKALLQALPGAQGHIRLSLVEALGNNHYTEAVPAITSLAGDKDGKLSKVALYALSGIADPRSENILSRAAKKSGYTFDSTNATSAYLYYIQRLVQDGKLDQAEKAATSLFKQCRKANQAHTRTAALNLLDDIRDHSPFTLSRDEKKEGFKVLFDGTNMDQWTGNKQDYVIENNAIVIHEKGGHGNLYTKDEYRNFIFRFSFQLTPGANNGIGIRAPLEGDAAYVGMEIQVLDNTANIYRKLQPYQYHGSVYGVIPAKRGYLKPVGEWNEEEIVADGPHIKVTLNGTVILDGDITEASKNGTMDHRQHPGLNREQGHIGFLGHGTTVRFRHIRVKELDNK